MRLENWSIKENEEDGEIRKRLRGAVYGSHGFEEGQYVVTSYVTGKFEGKVVTVAGSLYELGKKEDVLSEYNNRLLIKDFLDTLPEVPEPNVNRAKCLNCNTILESHYRHDFQECSCPNGTYTDGGLDYQRCGGEELTKIAVWDNDKKEWINCFNEVTSNSTTKPLSGWFRPKITKVYKILHIPTGLYFTPNSSKNLNKKGKVYHSKPNISFTKYSSYKEEDWKIVTFKLERIDEEKD